MQGLIGCRVEWHVRRWTKLKAPPEFPLTVFPSHGYAFSAVGDRLGDEERDPPNTRWANPDTWHESDVVMRGEVRAWDPHRAVLLVEADSGEWAQVPIQVVKSCESREEE